jgi:hypothetical protein
MLNAAGYLSWFSALLVVAAVVAWVRLLRTPALQPIRGNAQPTFQQAELASGLLMISFGLGGLGAVLAAAGWVLR